VARASGPGEFAVVLIDEAGAIQSLASPLAIAKSVTLEPSGGTDVTASLPLKSCDQNGTERLPAGTYSVAAVVIVAIDGGDPTLVRGPVTSLTYR
jgi:hypothetical protein